jgi:hypothetical protein
VKVDIPRVIAALQQSENDPAAAIGNLEAEAEEREGEAEALRQVAGAVKLLTGFESNGAHAAPPAAGDVPQGIEAVRRVMTEGGVWTAQSLLEELIRRGWEPKNAQHPLQTIHAAIDRLYRVKEEIDRVERGTYTRKGHPASPSFETLESGEYRPL